MSLIDHLENYLGEIEEGWAPEWNKDLQIIRFKNTPLEEVSSFVSLGLSKHILKINNREIRQELIFSAYDKFSFDDIAMCLALVCKRILTNHNALLRGELLKMNHRIIPGKDFYGLYVAIPVFFEDDFCVYISESMKIVIAWLIPLYTEEIDFIQSVGWEKFEDLLEEGSCDFWDLDRERMSFVK
ncbi:suppressor of fused domain protein [Leptospira licerasiae]|uniref:Suppressor of fused protein n=1 Tax=Leptospira licerasiae str. MMD4847 TaxID=1049971 RepID=A0ABN0H7A7_9LEPT|nr:suppressor of fused domain protein [Leptospira licerasiae]EID99568.1 suppressor of fused protein [Leptospira licerasiae serovar Varillal str. VAR 010]EJZ41549.1 suppressor of fused protein [Leptospira licerasiae str. MMD4847]